MSDFFAYLSRMKYIKRWSLMHSIDEENVMEHTEEVTVIAHALATIGNKMFGKNYDIEKVLSIALFHETSEVVTGDLPTPIKYFNKEINSAYKSMEDLASNKLLQILPEPLIDEYKKAVLPDKDSIEYAIVKKADKLSAYIKCLEEVKIGNKEFAMAKKSIEKDVNNMQEEEVKYFIKEFLPAFTKTLDELSC